MKRFFNIIPLLFSLLCFWHTAQSANADITANLFNVGDSLNVSQSYSVSGMQKNEPAKAHVLIIFRNGIDEKAMLFSHGHNGGQSFTNIFSKENDLNDQGRIKYILSFAFFLALTPEFLSVSSPHSPPFNC